jgi:type IV fimbrial biogenesis protein FimT
MAGARTRGFTLIELMVALAIAALLLLIGLPSFTTFLRNSEIRSTSESLLNGLKAAQAEAANRNKNVTFQLADATGADWRFWVLDDDGVTQVLQSYSKKEAGSSSKITLTRPRPAHGHLQRPRPGRHRPSGPRQPHPPNRH